MNNYTNKTVVTTDVSRIINKFDIYQCNLGDINKSTNNTLTKTRPCVIISSDDINCVFSNQFVVIPIRTVHKDVTDDNIEEYVNNERSLGRICVPVKMHDTIRVLDVNQIRQIPNSKIYNYVGTIVNKDLRKTINRCLMELLFSKDEFIDNNNENIQKRNIKIQNDLKEIKVDSVEEIIDTPKPIQIDQPIIETELITKKNKGGRKLKFATGFSIYYKAWAIGKMTPNEIANKCNVHISTIYNHIKKYHELHPEIEVKIKTKII